jgi:integrase/recombinase XerD
VLLLTIYAGGLRREDACRLKWRALKDREDGSGQITAFGKGGKTGFVMFPASVLEEIRALKAKKDGTLASEDEPVFASRKKNTARGGHLDPSQVNRIVKKAAKRAGLSEDVSPHWLRHSHATHAKSDLRPLTPVREERVDVLHGHLEDVDERDRATVYRLDVCVHRRHTATSSQLET